MQKVFVRNINTLLTYGSRVFITCQNEQEIEIESFDYNEMDGFITFFPTEEWQTLGYKGGGYSKRDAFSLRIEYPGDTLRPV